MTPMEIGPSRPAYQEPTDVESTQPAAETTTPQGEPDTPNVTLESLARDVYEGTRLFHATDAEGKESIRANGFKSSEKTSGLTDNVKASLRQNLSPDTYNQLTKEISANHYLTDDKNLAKSLASGHHQNAPTPSIVRTIGVKENFETKPDPLAGPFFQHSIVVGSDIPQGYILGSKKSSSGPDSVTFQRALNKAGINISEDKAKDLLKGAQSDSEDDFEDSGDES
jgi:hypothetical protein